MPWEARTRFATAICSDALAPEAVEEYRPPPLASQVLSLNCESGGNWGTNTGNGFYGGLQFSESTWLANGGGQYSSTASGASASEQIAVANRVLASQGIGAWPVCGANG